MGQYARPREIEILHLALPAVIATITTPLLGLMDVAFTGHMGGAAYLAAIALGSNLFNILYWPLGFLRMSTSGIASQAYGAGDDHAVRLSLLRPLATGIVLGLLLIVFQGPVFSLYEWITDGDAGAVELAHRYFAILVWGAPAMLATFALTGWFIGLGRARASMWTALSVNVVNLGVSMLLVVGMHMKIDGVAIGTLVAQWTGLAIAIVLATRAAGPALWHRREGFWESRPWRRIWAVNRDLFLRTLCMTAVTLWFTREGARQGDVMLGANALLMQLFIFFSYFSDGLAYAAEALAGRCYGAGDATGLRLTVRRVLKWGAIVALVFSVIYFVGGEWILGLLSDDGDVVASAADFMPWVVAVPLASFGAFAYDGVMVGLTVSRHMLGSIAVAAALYFGVFFGMRALGSDANVALWTAFLVYLVARSCYGAVWYRRGL